MSSDNPPEDNPETPPDTPRVVEEPSYESTPEPPADTGTDATPVEAPTATPSPPADTTDTTPAPTEPTPITAPPSPPPDPNIELIKKGISELESGAYAQGVEDIVNGLEGLTHMETSLPSHSRWSGIAWEVRQRIEKLYNRLA